MTGKKPQSPHTQLASSITGEDWSQIRETIVMLNLATAQVEYSMTDGDDSIDVLTDSFTTMSNGIQSISEAVQSFSQFSDIEPALQNEVLRQCSDISNKMQNAIIAFQFYDKLVQRLSHVRNSLTELAALIGDEERLHTKAEWQKLQSDVRTAYTMETDRKLFDAIMAGTAIEDVLSQMSQGNSDETNDSDDIELF